MFLAYKGAFGIDDNELYHTLRLAKELGVIVTAHCENAELVAETASDGCSPRAKPGPEWHERSRPARVEAEGVHHLCTFAEMLGTHVYIVHTSNDDAIQAAVAARRRGVHVWIETVAPYLVLDASYAEKPDFEGAKYVMSPPLRPLPHQDAIWNALASRTISTVATDHAPFDFKGQKEMGRDDFTKIPNGIPSVEDRVNLVYTLRRKTRPDRLAHHWSTPAARSRRSCSACSRGRARLPWAATPISWSTTPIIAARSRRQTQSMNVDYSAFEGWPIEGRPDVVTVRGKVQVRDGKFVGRFGFGELLVREPSHF